METAQQQAILRDHIGAADVGGAIQCKGCGEIGRAVWERGPAGGVQTLRAVTRLSGNFYLHNGQIACGRCQQIYRPG